MSSLFERFLGRSKDSSADKAKERLQFVLVHDRINLPPDRLAEMKQEILAVISKYVAVEPDKVDIALEQRDRNNNMLVAEIPFSKSLEKPAPEEEIEENDDISALDQSQGEDEDKKSSSEPEDESKTDDK